MKKNLYDRKPLYRKMSNNFKGAEIFTQNTHTHKINEDTK